MATCARSSWRMSTVQTACKTGFIVTVFFCVIEFLLVQRVPYQHDVAIEGILKKKVDVDDYGSAFSISSDADDGKENPVAKRRKLSSDRSFSRENIRKDFPPNSPARQERRKLGKIQMDIRLTDHREEGSESVDIPLDIPDAIRDDLIHQPLDRSESKRFGEGGRSRDVPKQISKLERKSTNSNKRHSYRTDQGQVEDMDHAVFIQLNRTRAQVAQYLPYKYSPPSPNGAVQSHTPRNGMRILPFEKPGYVWRPEGPGEMGKGVDIPAEDAEMAGSVFKRHQFNVIASDMIALNRSLPDKRPPRCRMFGYRHDLPRASVIIVFHNEARSVLLRTIWSVILQSPNHLLEEIVLVDDASNHVEDWYKSWLKNYTAHLPVPTRLIRMPSRSGVVGARLAGVSAASGKSQVLVFLDSHCECTEGWLEPLLDCIHRNSSRVVSPAIDSISDTDFAYTFIQGMARTGGFTWFPEFMWTHASPREARRVWHDTSTPLSTPTIAGGLFAIDREFFKRLGYYDPDLRVWGSENLELSFKVWQCGGSLEVVPCSRVGHVFRARPPYDFPGDADEVLIRNNKRVLEVWASDVKSLFYGLTPEYAAVDAGDVSARESLRDSLKCRSFQWYLKEVYPEHILPLEFQFLGRLMNQAVGLCLDVVYASDGRRLGAHIALNDCREGALVQTFSWNMGSQLQHDHFCISSVEGDTYVMLLSCLEIQYSRRLTHQQWQYNEDTLILEHQLTGRCMGLEEKMDRNASKYFAILEDCTGEESQEWTVLHTPIASPWS